MSNAKTSKREQTSKEEQTTPAVPEVIYAQASPRSLGGVSMFDAQQGIASTTVASFFSDDEIVRRAANRLEDAGFSVLQVTRLTINIAGSAETYRRAFNTEIVADERPAIKEQGREDTATFLDSSDTSLSGLISTAGTRFEDVLEGVAIEEPRYFMAPLSLPPIVDYWHLDVPADVSLGCNADRAHRAGTTGRGVRVAMIDSGWYRHPFFVERGYRAAPVVLGPAASNPLNDESGHGTGESANIFAVAPDVELLPIKLNFVNTIGAFNAAVALNPDIITCSWGSHVPNGPLSAANQALAAAIAAAVASGITVIFSAGNGHAGFPGQHPDVISAGGSFLRPDGTFEASNYSSGFMSTIYAGRRVPDLCGLVGMRPRAIYIMLPLEPGDDIDTDLGGGSHPNGDETANNDGWAAFSGTSAAAPQLAGAAALIKQACPRLSPAAIRNILMTTARDVTAGSCNTVPGIHGGLPAAAGPDNATGNGVVDAQRATLIAKIRCLGPIVPPITIRPPIQPPIVVQPPITPPIVPPITPPITPPIVPPIIPPIVPPPVGPQAMAGQAEGAAAQQPAAQLSEDDVKALEEMVLGSDVDLDL